MKVFMRKFHRWLGLLMAVQIIAWMASGLYFSIYPISEIRGEHLTREAPELETRQLTQLGSASDVHDILEQHFAGDWELESARLFPDGNRTLWRVSGMAAGKPFVRLVDALGKGIEPHMNRDEAARKAQDWVIDAGEVEDVQYLETDLPGGEFRNGTFPVWQVRFLEPEGVSVYIHPWTGELLARRTNRWRVFDFLWMLHVMDFETRDDFNHPLLQVAALLGLLIALSGVLFWAMTTRLFRRSRQSMADLIRHSDRVDE